MISTNQHTVDCSPETFHAVRVDAFLGVRYFMSDVDMAYSTN